MRKQGYRESTTYFSVKSLKWVARRTNLLEPEQAEACLASANLRKGSVKFTFGKIGCQKSFGNILG
ncbi:MAG TPA: hypothetical protein VJZ75_09415 [Candidatus Bathyarchaeia archaeon]|nr:hypothetical protein [Candidatus Bathyarchaeia archaeon]